MSDVRRTGYGTIAIVGGGCYGSYYLRQLGRARAAGAVDWRRVIVVDRDPGCRIARRLRGEPAPSTTSPAATATTTTTATAAADGAAAAAPDDSGPPPPDTEFRMAEWGAFFDEWLGAAARDPDAHALDAIVPSPLMPHLMSDWLRTRARERWPGRPVETLPLPRLPHTPWSRAGDDGTAYVSFAEWICPINCIEPPLCPEIKGPRSWSMPPAMRAYVEAMRTSGDPLEGPVLFHCEHRAYGVGMFDVRDVLAGDQTVARAGTGKGSARILVGTVSHCHGALSVLGIGGAVSGQVSGRRPTVGGQRSAESSGL